MMLAMQIEDPLELWKEIGAIIHEHYQQRGEVMPFSVAYPTLNKLYLGLVAESPDVQNEVRNLRLKRRHGQ